jgi:CRP/FNR family transcriptional regulator
VQTAFDVSQGSAARPGVSLTGCGGIGAGYAGGTASHPARRGKAVFRPQRVWMVIAVACRQDAFDGSRCAACPVQRQGLCGQLGATTRSGLAQIATEQGFAANQRVWEAEGDIGLVGVLISGCLRMQSHSIDGHRQIFSLVLPGDIVSEPGGLSNGYQLEAATPALLCRFAPQGFQRLLESAPDLARAAYALRVAKLEQLRILTWSLGALSVDERLCGFLAMATRFLPYVPLPAGGGTLTVEISRADIADLLGTTQESISRITHRLHLRGAIRIRGPQQFEIPDLSRLVAMGCMQDVFQSRRFAVPPRDGAAHVAIAGAHVRQVSSTTAR